MKMELNVKMTFGGKILLTENSNNTREGFMQSDSFKRNYVSEKSMDLCGLTCDIQIDEHVEDITPKEYIQAVGEFLKTTLSGIIINKINKNNHHCYNVKHE